MESNERDNENESKYLAHMRKRQRIKDAIIIISSILAVEGIIFLFALH